MPLVLAGATSGSATIQATDAATVTRTLPSTSGTLVTTGGAQTIEFADGTVSAPSITNSGDTNTGIFFPAADTIAFTEGGVESMRIDSSGNVGIGTSSPAYKLDVQGTANSTLVSLGTARPFRISAASDGTNDDAIWNLNATSGVGQLRFSTANTERMRIDSNGCVSIGVGNVIAGEKLLVYGSVADNISRMYSTGATPYGLLIRYTGAAPNNTGQEFLYCLDTGGARAYIRSNGGFSNYQANNTNLSDEREKTNIELAGNYLDKICSIPVKTFLYNDQTDDELNLGVIAQDVQSVAPELVTENNWAGKDDPEKMRLSIYQTDLQYALMKAIQELNAKVTALEAQLGAR